MKEGPIPLLMDVDAGVDDALAILLALHSPNLKLVGITTVSGNCSSRQAALNTRFLLDQFVPDITVPIRIGEHKSFDGRVPTPAPEIHGEDGFGGVSASFWAQRKNEQTLVLEKTQGVDFILELAERYGERLALVATGPLTNIARAIHKNAEAVRNAGRLLVMGGAVATRGNVTEFAEFNVYCDPEAYGVVLRSGIPLTLFPLDVTEKVRIWQRSLTPELGIDEKKLTLIKAISDTYMSFHELERRDRGFPVTGPFSFVHDTLPVASLLGHHIFTFHRKTIAVDESSGNERGRLRSVPPGEGGAEVELARSVDPQRFLELFWATLRRTEVQCLFAGDRGESGGQK